MKPSIEKSPSKQSIFHRWSSTFRRKVSKGNLLKQGEVEPINDSLDAVHVNADAYDDVTKVLPSLFPRNYRDANFLWEDSDESCDSHSEVRDSSLLNRSDGEHHAYGADNDSASYNTGGGGGGGIAIAAVNMDDSGALGYEYSANYTQEVVQQDSGSWESQEEAPAASVMYGNWAEGFREVSHRIENFGPNTSVAERIEAYTTLINLTEDFLLAVRSYGRIIISEAHLPPEKKTIPLMTSLGGVIGGQKYLVHGILFKFSSDDSHIFSQNNADVIAAKISGHELKGLLAVDSCAIPGLHTPLMALVDYKGFRLIAMSQLPISKSTLVLGSANGGLTVENSSPEAVERLEKVGKALNLKAHRAGTVPEKSQELFTPIDLEAHMSGGKIYLCDFSRMMPPEKPPKTAKQNYLFQLLRREFVASYPVALSCDAFSKFTKPHRNHKADNDEVARATEVLYHQRIPQVAQDLEELLQGRENKTITSFRLSAALHSHGVNVRHLFRVYERCREKSLRALIMVEMIARVVVADMREKLRFKTRTLPVSMAETYYLSVLASRLNVVFGSTPLSVNYWNRKIRRRLFAKFCGYFGCEYYSPEFCQTFPEFQRSVSFKAATMMNYTFEGNVSTLHVLFSRIQQIMGFVMKSAIEKQLASPQVFSRLCLKQAPFRATDLAELGMRVKHMNLVSFARGFLFLTQGLAARASDPRYAIRLLGTSVKNFEDALSANTNSKTALRACAKALVYYAEETARLLQPRGRLQMSNSSRSVSEEHDDTVNGFYKRADAYFCRAIAVDPRDAESHFAYAAYLDRTGNREAAEMHYREAIKCDATHVDACKSYGDFLTEQKRPEEAEAMYLIARNNSKKAAE